MHCPSLKTKKAELRVITGHWLCDGAPLELSRDKPMIVKGWFNVLCDALECSAMGEGNTVWYFWFFLSTSSSEGKLFLQT